MLAVLFVVRTKFACYMVLVVALFNIAAIQKCVYCRYIYLVVYNGANGAVVIS